MKILVGNNHLVKTGGTENYTYALALELAGRGHEVEYFAFERGAVSDRLEAAGIPFMSQPSYDLILANHGPVIDFLYTRGFIVQTCHGIVPGLEEPSPNADMYVAISEEVRDSLAARGYKSEIIPNGIDCKRFSPQRPLPDRLSCVLSLCQSDQANQFIRECCDAIHVSFLAANKHTDNVWHVEELINKADLVVGIGRSVLDAMACGRNVICYDYRCYMERAMGDGFLTSENMAKSFTHNCSGRSTRRDFTHEEFIQELQKYSPENGAWARDYIVCHHNISVAADKYLQLPDKADYREGLVRTKGKIAMLREEQKACTKMIARQKQELTSSAAMIQYLTNKRKEHLRVIRLLAALALALLVGMCIIAIA